MSSSEIRSHRRKWIKSPLPPPPPDANQVSSTMLALYLLNILVICCTLAKSTDHNSLQSQHGILASENIEETTNLALKNNAAIAHQLSRRQVSESGGSPATNSNSNQASPQGSSSKSATSSDSTNGGPTTDPQQDPDKQEEALNSLKCDFGSADSPDLCKFRIVDATNAPPIKGLTTWSHGSGKLALYQGGPLIDASGGNDTSGGYIFYETSSPFVNTPPASNGSSSGYSPVDYSTISAHLMKQTHHNTPEQQPDRNLAAFQHVSSARVIVGPGSSPPSSSSSSIGPSFISPNLTAPGPSGMCLSFQYAIKGLSAEELRIYVNDHRTERSRLIWASSESAAGNWTRGEVLYSVTNMHSLMFSASSSPSSSAVSKDLQQRKFRGYLALDELEIQRHDPGANEGACKGHCNFDGDLCGWTNAESGQEDDFDWSFGRGSDNLFTGPARDYVSSTNNELTGSYLHTDSGYPRRPGDRAILVSPMFQPTAVNDAMCMRLAVHMFGSGIGSLAIKIRYADESVLAPPPTSSNQPGAQPLATSQSTSSGKPNNDLIIWEMSGDAGNSWHQAQTSVSSSKSQFQVLIEGVIGENHLGNIAIDEISFSSGPCPTSPPVASKNYGDCTFEQSMCYWRNPDAEIHLDDLDWIRSADEQSIHGPNFDHTLKKRSGSYLKLENTFREPKSGTRAFLLSPIFQPKPGNVQCLSFYYYMFMRSISSSGPNLGTIRVYLASNNELVPIWRLTNPISSPNWKHGRASLSTALIDGQPTAPTKLFQIAFEGIWGDAAGGAIALDDITVFDGACDIMPPEAKSVPGECTFDVDMCSWSNKTSDQYLLMSNSLDSTDSSRSPFIQSVNSASSMGNSPIKLPIPQSLSKRQSWQLATVDSRPVNLQDHTYKAPIGYTYVDVLDSSAKRMAFPLQSAESTVQPGTQIVHCLSFWFAAFGRNDNNQLNVYLTQASAPPSPPEDGGASNESAARPNRNGRQPSGPSPSGATNSAGNQAAGGSTNANSNPNSASSSPTSGDLSSSPLLSGGALDSDSENPQAWKFIDGKLLWSVGLRNITEIHRRKWQYGQVTLKADSNYIVRFVAFSNDGGFALDDISYYEGACETRPAMAKVVSDDEDSAPIPQAGTPTRPNN